LLKRFKIKSKILKSFRHIYKQLLK